MREEFLHYIWKYKRFIAERLSSTAGHDLKIVDQGLHNHDSGPDFFNARIKIDGQLWAGNVEIHLKSSDWYVHQHQNDSAYDNVILHVVWLHDSEVLDGNGSAIVTLELSAIVAPELVLNYHQLMKSRSWINCERDFQEVNDLILMSWLERLCFERLEQKSTHVTELLEQHQNNWEYVLFILMFRGFGLKVNADAFESCARSIDYRVFRKTRFNLQDLEALFFGQSGLLKGSSSDAYFKDLKERYYYQTHKYKLSNSGVLPLKRSRLRPANFPSLRLAQLAALFHKTDQLFTELMAAKSVRDIYDLLKIESSDYWKTHYNFGLTAHKSSRELTSSFMDLIIINTLLPLKFIYSKLTGRADQDLIIEILHELPVEKNAIVNKYLQLKSMPRNAMTSQGLLQLKKFYCDKNACLSCSVANNILL